MPKGKIVKAMSGFYYVKSEEGIIQCRGRGLFRNQKISPLVGDNVVYQAENETDGYIMEIDERTNELIRPSIANVDQALLVFSAAEPAFSTTLLDKFLVLIESKGIEPIICVSKIDLLDEKTKEEVYAKCEVYERIGYTVIKFSSETSEGLECIKPYLSGKSSVLAGQSGVGKSSLLNAINEQLSIKTGGISRHLGRGRHTTRHVELLEVEDGFVADTPGFSSLEFDEVELEDLGACFPEFHELSSGCKFRGCLHLAEPKCAVKSALESNDIADFRYKHYLQFVEDMKSRKPKY